MNEAEAVIEAIPAGIYTLLFEPETQSARFSFANWRFFDLLGVDRAAIDHDPWQAFVNVATEDAGRLAAANRAALEGAAPLLFEGHFVVAGETRRLRLEAAPRRRDDGRLEWSGVVVALPSAGDAAAQTMAERAEQFRHAQETDGEGLWDWRLDAGAFTVGQGWLGMLGYAAPSATELEEAVVVDLIHPEDRAMLATARQLLETQGHFSIDLRMRAADGGYRRVASAGKAIESDVFGKPLRAVGAHTDMTQRRRIERETATTRAMLETTLAATAEGLCVIDIDGDLVHVNDGFARLLRFDDVARLPRRLDDFAALLEIATLDGAIVPLDDWPARRALRGERGELAELAFTRRDLGESWIVRCAFAPVLDPTGVILGAVLAASDITGARRAATALQESEMRLGAALRDAHMGLFDFDPSTGVSYWSEHLYRLFARDPHLGPLYYDELQAFLAPDSRALLDEKIRDAVAAGASFEIDAELAPRPGAVAFATIRADAVRGVSGAVVALRGVIQDASARKAAENALQGAAARLELSTALAPTGFAVFDRDMRLLVASHRWIDDNGLSGRAVLGLRHDQLFPDASPQLAEIHTRALAGEALRCDEERRIGPEGQMALARWEARPWRDGSGEIGGVAIYAENDGDESAPRAEPVRVDADFERRGEARMAALLEAQRRAEAANAAKTAFLANMNEVLRAPIASLLEAARQALEDASASRRSERRAQIDDVGARLSALLDDSLDLVRIEAGRLPLERREFDMKRLLDGVAASVASQAGAKGLAVSVDADDVPHWVCGDEARLRQALTAFAENAVTRAEAGTVTLRAALLLEDGEELLVRFEMQDSGANVAPDALERLFAPFEQIDGERRGVGLALARRLAGAMGGTAGVDNTDAGARFWFTARLGRDQRPGAAESAPAGDPAAAPAPAMALDIQAGLTRVGGNRLLYERRLRRFREFHHGDMDVCAARLAMGDRVGAADAIQTLGGAAAELGMRALADACAALEQTIRRSGEGLDAPLDAARRELVALISTLQAQFPGDGD